MNKFELEVKESYEAKGWTVYKDGWPDFLCFRIVDGKPEIRLLEAKARKDKLRPNQHAMLLALSTAIPVYTAKQYNAIEGFEAYVYGAIRDEEFHDMWRDTIFCSNSVNRVIALLKKSHDIATKKLTELWNLGVS